MLAKNRKMLAKSFINLADVLKQIFKGTTFLKELMRSECVSVEELIVNKVNVLATPPSPEWAERSDRVNRESALAQWNVRISASCFLWPYEAKEVRLKTRNEKFLSVFQSSFKIWVSSRRSGSQKVNSRTCEQKQTSCWSLFWARRVFNRRLYSSSVVRQLRFPTTSSSSQTSSPATVSICCTSLWTHPANILFLYFKGLFISVFLVNSYQNHMYDSFSQFITSCTVFAGV